MGKKGGDLVAIVVLALTYFGAAKLGLKLAFIHPSATPIWAPTGIALAAFLLLGYGIWPGIWLGAFLANVTTAGSVLTSLAVASGNTLEGVVGCYLVNRFASGRRFVERAQEIFKFTLLAGLLGTTVSASIGVSSLALGGFADWAKYWSIWSTWWLGDAVGAAVVTPLVLLWWENPRLDWTRRQFVELGCLFVGLFLVAYVIFGGRFNAMLKNYPLEYLCTPFLIWAAFRFGRRKAATATFFLGIIATWGTWRGFGPFSGRAPNTSLLLLQEFMGIVAITSLALAAEVTEHNRAEERVRQLAVTDPLTGLANYRKFIEALELEIRRYGRTNRPFAVLLVDLDGLKTINDSHGHLAGNRALCRLAEVLRAHSREVDIPARYGGDEFAVILPETNAEAARLIAERIRERAANDGEEPPISLSIGIAVFPDDGQAVETLLSHADQALYQMKRRSRDPRGRQKRRPAQLTREAWRL